MPSHGPVSTWPTAHPELIPFLPLVYVAWADGVLSEAERRVICERVDRQDWLSEKARASLLDWLDPTNPPSPVALQLLRERLARLRASDDTLRSLTEVGIELARVELGDRRAGDESPWSHPGAAAALAEIEAALGVIPAEAAREALRVEAPPLVAEKVEARSRLSGLADLLDGEFGPLRGRVFDILAQEALRIPLETSRDEYRERVFEGVRLLAREGLGRIGYPPEFGGEDRPDLAIVAFETLAHGDLSTLVKYGVHFGLFGGSVLQLGTRAHHERYLRAIGSLELPGAFAMTERGHGSNVREIETTATWDGTSGEFVIHTPSPSAMKDWIGNAALHGRMATVFAQLEVGGRSHGVHALLVPIRDDEGRPLPGVTIEDCGLKVGLNGVDNGRLGFDRVRIPRENLLDRFASVSPDGLYSSPIPSPGRRFFTMLGTLVAGRISIGAASVSVAKSALTTAVRYSDRREQFGPAGEGEVLILDYLTQQRRLLLPLARTYALHFAIRDLVRRYAEMVRIAAPSRGVAAAVDGTGSRAADTRDEAGIEARRREIEALAAGLKAYASRHAVETVQGCREACGGRGYAAENRFGRLRADADVFTTFEGVNVVLLQLVAKGLLSRYADEMGELRFWDVVKYLAERAQTRVTELNPVIVRRTDEDHLRDPEFHRAALIHREERLLASAAQRLKALLDEGVDSFEAMNRVQDHLVTLATAHVERVVLECFLEAVEETEDEETGEVLRRLEALFALATIEEHRGWYLEARYMEGQKTRAVRTLVNSLCGELRRYAVPLVDAFGIPDAVLAAPDGITSSAS